jgi:hypothetical protein
MIILNHKDVAENLFKKLLQLEEGCTVESVNSDFIQIVCLIDQFEGSETGEFCKVYDHAPMWRGLHLNLYLNANCNLLIIR